jgi:DNA-directed RNA polymerase subunit M/transcription elongation factor TFIIS
MKFCEKCGSYMQETKDGFVCRRCGNLVQANAVSRTKDTKKERSRAIYIVDSLEDESVTVSQVCPKCGNGEAYRWVSNVSGEHAGIRRERTIEHFRCTSCSHSWSKTS